MEGQRRDGVAASPPDTLQAVSQLGWVGRARRVNPSHPIVGQDWDDGSRYSQ